MFTLVPLIIRNVLRNRRRTLLTLVSSGISLGLLALLLNLYQAFFHMPDVSPAQARRLICRHKVSFTQPLPLSQERQIQSMPGVEVVSPYTWFQGKFGEGTNLLGPMGVDAETIFEIYPEWKMPADQLAAFKKGRNACALGWRIAKHYGLKVGDTITVIGDIYPVDLELKIVGIFDGPAMTECLVFHQEYLRELLPEDNVNRDTVGMYVMLADNPGDAPRVAREIDSYMAKNSPVSTRTEPEKEFFRAFMAFLGDVRLFLAAISGAVTFTIMLVCANTVAMSVRERTRELAVLRALGYRRGEILKLVLGESVVISLGGGFVGLGIGEGISRATQILAALFGLPDLQWQICLIVLGASVAVGLLAAVVPGLIAARRNVVESLRFAG
jgi:putative ABC transport system permease protein